MVSFLQDAVTTLTTAATASHSTQLGAACVITMLTNCLCVLQFLQQATA